MRVACCQFDIAWEDKPANYIRVERRVREAQLEPGTLLLLPEMFATGFSMNASEIVESSQGPTSEFVEKLARDFQIYVLAGLVLGSEGEQPRNSAILVDPAGAQVCEYAKIHRFSYAGEDQHYAAGSEPVSCAMEGCTVQPTICYDLRFPELFRSSKARGAELICVIANWPAARDSHWMALLKARAIENQAYVAAVNRIGRDPGVEYRGRSQIISPRGGVVEDAEHADVIIRAELDLDGLRAYRSRFPALRDMRL